MLNRNEMVTGKVDSNYNTIGLEWWEWHRWYGIWYMLNPKTINYDPNCNNGKVSGDKEYAQKSFIHPFGNHIHEFKTWHVRKCLITCELYSKYSLQVLECDTREYDTVCGHQGWHLMADNYFPWKTPLVFNKWPIFVNIS